MEVTMKLYEVWAMLHLAIVRAPNETRASELAETVQSATLDVKELKIPEGEGVIADWIVE